MSFWIDDPTILLNSKYIFDVLPNEHQSNTQNLNALSRFVIWISLFGYIILKKKIILILGFVILGMIAIFHSYKEGYVEYNYSTISKDLSTINPLGNTLMSDYKYNTNKKDSIPKLPTKSNKSYGKTPSFETQYGVDTEQSINDKTKEFIYEHNKENENIKDLFKDKSDQIEFEHQMRPFHTTPNTTIPNDQSGFLTYCYGILPSDKSVISY